MFLGQTDQLKMSGFDMELPLCEQRSGSYSKVPYTMPMYDIQLLKHVRCVACSRLLIYVLGSCPTTAYLVGLFGFSRAFLLGRCLGWIRLFDPQTQIPFCIMVIVMARAQTHSFARVRRPLSAR